MIKNSGCLSAIKLRKRKNKHMKVFILLILSVMYCVSVLAQSLIKPDHKVVNMGVKVGLRALQSDISSIDMDEVRLEDIHLKHNVGYMAGFLIRVNVDRFFIQPSAFWNYSSGDIRFDVIRPASEQTNESAVEFPQSMTMQIKSFEVPVVVGYHLIKQHPYVFNLMGSGPGPVAPAGPACCSGSATTPAAGSGPPSDPPCPCGPDP